MSDITIKVAEGCQHRFMLSLINIQQEEINRLQNGIDYLLDRSGKKPCTRLELAEIAARLVDGDDVAGSNYGEAREAKA